MGRNFPLASVVRAAWGAKDDRSHMSETKRDYEVGRGNPSDAEKKPGMTLRLRMEIVVVKDSILRFDKSA
jgi:hypothetical protein